MSASALEEKFGTISSKKARQSRVYFDDASHVMSTHIISMQMACTGIYLLACLGVKNH